MGQKRRKQTTPANADQRALTISREWTRHPIQDVLQAEERIARSGPPLRAEIDSLLEETPEDCLGHLWAGLIAAEEDRAGDACAQYIQALQLGCDHWRVAWYLAQAAARAGDVELVDRACSAVLAANREFWFARELPKHARGYYGQSGQDAIIEEFFESRPASSKVFVEVGAFDGVHYSNVRRLHERHGWSGVSIEPVTKNFRKLAKSYEGTSVQCVQAAVADHEGRTQINVSTYPHLPEWGSDVACLSGESMDRWSREYGARWEKQRVRLARLTSVLDECGVEEIALLSVDAEGVELDVLKSLDFSRFKPDLIVVETNEARDAILGLLGDEGYSLWRETGQDLYVARDPEGTR